MNKALPTNSVRFINGDTCGIRRFNTNPAKNAPKIPSIPANSAKAALRKTNASTKIYCITLSSYLRKNQRAKRGNTKNTKTQYTTHLPTKIIHELESSSPLYSPEIPANTKRATVNANIVPPMDMETEL